MNEGCYSPLNHKVPVPYVCSYVYEADPMAIVSSQNQSVALGLTDLRYV